MANKRYKILDGALDYLKFGNEATNVKLPDGTPLRTFQEWRNKERKIEYDTTNWGKPGEIKEVTVHPFNRPYFADVTYIVPISDRALTATPINAIRGKANINTTPNATATRVVNYQPARVTITTPNTALDDPNAVSKITGIKYNKKGFSSYTIPYGQSSSANYEETVRAEIRDAVPNTSNFNLQFSSEEY